MCIYIYIYIYIYICNPAYEIDICLVTVFFYVISDYKCLTYKKNAFPSFLSIFNSFLHM